MYGGLKQQTVRTTTVGQVAALVRLRFQFRQRAADLPEASVNRSFSSLLCEGHTFLPWGQVIFPVYALEVERSIAKHGPLVPPDEVVIKRR